MTKLATDSRAPCGAFPVPWAVMLPMLPFMRPTNTRLVVSLKTAKVLELTEPPTLLAGAAQVIE